MGKVLVLRTRPCRATEAGQILVRLAGQTALLRSAAFAEVMGRGETLRLAVAVNADSLSTWFPRALEGLPSGVVVDLQREDQDHSAALLRDGSVMAAVTADARPVQGCRSEALGAMRYLAVASPDYHARWFGAGVPAALGVAPTLTFNRKDALQRRFIQQVTGQRHSPAGALRPVVVGVPGAGPAGPRLGDGARRCRTGGDRGRRARSPWAVTWTSRSTGSTGSWRRRRCGDLTERVRRTARGVLHCRRSDTGVLTPRTRPRYPGMSLCVRPACPLCQVPRTTPATRRTRRPRHGSGRGPHQLHETKATTVRTYTPKPGEVEQTWHVVDATDVVLGRLATQVAPCSVASTRPPSPRTWTAATSSS